MENKYYLKVCDECVQGKRSGDVISVDTANIKHNWSYETKCEICNSAIHDGCIAVDILEKVGDVITVRITGLMKRD